MRNNFIAGAVLFAIGSAYLWGTGQVEADKDPSDFDHGLSGQHGLMDGLAVVASLFCLTGLACCFGGAYRFFRRKKFEGPMSIPLRSVQDGNTEAEFSERALTVRICGQETCF